jgi:AAA domain
VARDATVAWLAQHQIGYDQLLMRKAGDCRADDIIKEEFLDGLLAEGHDILLAGDGGCGKSTITLDLAARVSRGEVAWGLDYEPGIPAGVLLAGCEDSPHSTIIPLLLAAGADLHRINLVNGVKGVDSSFPFTLGRFDALAATLEGRPDIRLVVIDPVSAFLPADVDDCQDASIRTLLRPLAELIERYDVALILVRHLNKSESINAGNLVGGNRGWVNASRAAFLFGQDPGPEGQEDDRRYVMVQMKVNLSPRMRGLAYRIESLTLGAQDDVLKMPNFADMSAEDEKDMREQFRCVRWLGETDQTADDLTKARRGGRTEAAPKKAEVCAAWLRTYLGKYSWPDKEVNAAREQAGYSFQAYKDAKVQLKAEELEQRQRTGMGHPSPCLLLSDLFRTPKSYAEFRCLDSRSTCQNRSKFRKFSSHHRGFCHLPHSYRSDHCPHNGCTAPRSPRPCRRCQTATT